MQRSEKGSLISEETRNDILRHAIEGITESVVISALDNRILFVNQAAARLFGRPAGELIGLSPSLIHSPHEEKNLVDVIHQATLEHGSWQGEILNRHSDGHESTSWLTTSIIRNSAGEPIALIGIGRDITERRRAERALEHSHETYRAAIENAAGVPYQLDLVSDTYVFMSEGIRELLGLEPEGLARDRIREMVREVIVVDPEGDRDPRKYGEAFKEGRISRHLVDLRVELASGEEKWLSDCSLPLRDEITGEITASIGILQDITQRKRTEEALRATSRMEATSTLAGGIAHDFNNLMVAVLGNASLALRELGEDHPLASMLRQIENAAEQAGHLAQQMLAFARGGKYQTRLVNLNESIREALRLQSRAIPPRISVKTELIDNLWDILADPSQMNQVIMNLWINAIESITGPGTVTLRTENIEIPKSRGALRPGPHVALTVADTGVGMSRETQARLFEPFFSTKFQGRGLGMAAVHGIVTNHGGQIEIESELGKGSRLRVLLPARLPEAQATREPDQSPAGKGETILVVDDEETVLMVSKAMLERLGYTVLLAESAREAIELAHSHEGEIHLAILDMWMPDLGGTEVFPALRLLRPKTRVLICSGYELDDSAQALLDEGACGFISKPFRLETLASQLRAALSG
ncbi:PAS domain S-box protein [Candidatus Sumerlaeota bacterium]|nr:PAS domain S-box protein [Candidatus Sumerlaeota bacterium]